MYLEKNAKRKMLDLFYNICLHCVFNCLYTCPVHLIISWIPSRNLEYALIMLISVRKYNVIFRVQERQQTNEN